MQINGYSNSMYQIYAEMAQQRRMQGTSGTEEPDAAQTQLATENMYAANVQVAEIQQLQQAQEVAPSMEVGDRASQNGNDMTLDTAQPGGRASSASELLRLLGANTEGMSAAAAPNGEATARPSFMNQVLKSFSDAGAYESAMASDQANFGTYMQNLLQRTYGM